MGTVGTLKNMPRNWLQIKALEWWAVSPRRGDGCPHGNKWIAFLGFAAMLGLPGCGKHMIGPHHFYESIQA